MRGRECQQTHAGNRTLHRFCAPVSRGFLGVKSWRTPFVRWICPPKRAFAYFSPVRKVGRPGGETSSSQSPLCFVSAQGRRKLRFTSLLLLSPPNPLRWASAGAPKKGLPAPAGTGGGPVVVLWGAAAGRGSYFFIPRFFLIQRLHLYPPSFGS